MKLKEIFKDIFRASINVAKFCFLWAIIVLLVLVILHGVKFLLPIIINILKLSAVPISVTEPKSIFETSSKTTNFAIVYITALFTIMGTVVAFMSVWWHTSLKRLEKCHRDYEKFRENHPLETSLTTAKIFFLKGENSTAWSYIKNLSEDLNYEVPLYKARILMDQPHDESIYFTVINLLKKSLSFPKLTEEAKAMIYRYISFAYLKEKKDYKKALKFAEKAISENPIYWSAHIAKGRALVRFVPNRLDEAIGILERVIGEDEFYEPAYYNLACYYSEKAKGETNIEKRTNLKNKAIKYYKISIKFNPKNKEIMQDDSQLEFIKDAI
ncbi:MAG: tetratricopeptide repeat protein [Candidatus Aureabacteria bacterium]|nr:tetratricopeptide repeat protein [Candidatus Auribacterota bacterium]